MYAAVDILQRVLELAIAVPHRLPEHEHFVAHQRGSEQRGGESPENEHFQLQLDGLGVMQLEQQDDPRITRNGDTGDPCELGEVEPEGTEVDHKKADHQRRRAGKVEKVGEQHDPADAPQNLSEGETRILESQVVTAADNPEENEVADPEQRKQQQKLVGLEPDHGEFRCHPENQGENDGGAAGEQCAPEAQHLARILRKDPHGILTPDLAGAVLYLDAHMFFRRTVARLRPV